MLDFRVPHLESCGTPVHKVDGFLGLNGGYGCVDIFWNDVSSIEQAHGHIFAFRWITLHHLVSWLEAGLGDCIHAHRVVVRHFGGDQGGVGHKGEMNTRIRNLELELLSTSVEIVALTRFVWNSFKSTFRAPSNLEAFRINQISLSKPDLTSMRP